MKIISVKYIKDYKLEVVFSNRECKVANFEEFLKKSKHPSILKFLDIQAFKTVRIDTGFLSWNDGEMEISACSVYDDFCLKHDTSLSVNYIDKNKTEINLVFEPQNKLEDVISESGQSCKNRTKLYGEKKKTKKK